ncbi:capsule biosynthesis protein [Orrella marina]|uniref:capsule biosynthesis protein n=1 Tax=Orrella marina TaxID=2163011 RepID=UPI001D1307F4|nr:capsular biosynthesis protein [Orrella marina]
MFRINFNMGDLANWGGRASVSFRQKPDELDEFMRSVYERYDITDQILFGDRRAVHRPAIVTAPSYGITTHVFEEGYFRPYWVTLERGGVNRHSGLPKNPEWYREIGPLLPTSGKSSSFDNPFWKRATYDVLYHGAGMLNPIVYPGYRTHAPVTAPVEYGGFLWRQARQSRYQRTDRESLRRVLRSDDPFFFLPLQLNSDSQIRDHSDFDGMKDVLRYVMESFARHAPAQSNLLIKNHPLDIGLINYRKMVDQFSDELGIQRRAVYVDTGALNPILKRTAGVVTVNSTTGVAALEHGSPVITLSDPIYSMPGLTAQHGLDAFWQQPDRPDAYLFKCFRDTVIHTTQLNGGFYSREGIEKVIHNGLPRLISDESALEQLFQIVTP